MLAAIMAIESEEDQALVENIYILYAQKMKATAMAILHNKHDAEDCVHDTVLVVIKYLDRFKEIGYNSDYAKYLVIIACRNIAINKYHQNKRRRALEFSTTVYNEDDEAETMDIPDSEADVAKMVLSEYNVKYIKGLIEQLDTKYRDVIILRSMGFHHCEIAQIMCISEDSVRQRYCRAREKIKRMGGIQLYGYADE